MIQAMPVMPANSGTKNSRQFPLVIFIAEGIQQRFPLTQYIRDGLV
jgi:hypothetical protein